MSHGVGRLVHPSIYLFTPHILKSRALPSCGCWRIYFCAAQQRVSNVLVHNALFLSTRTLFYIPTLSIFVPIANFSYCYMHSKLRLFTFKFIDGFFNKLVPVYLVIIRLRVRSSLELSTGVFSRGTKFFWIREIATYQCNGPIYQ